MKNQLNQDNKVNKSYILVVLPSFCFAVYNEEVGRILLRQKNAQCFLRISKAKCGVAENLFFASYIGVYTR